MFNVIDGCIFFIICHDNEEKFTRNYNCLEVSSAYFFNLPTSRRSIDSIHKVSDITM